MNLFKSIFNKHWKTTDPIKLVDDLGGMKGIVTIKGVNLKTGKVTLNEEHNTLVNQSKSNLIRLISQGQSVYAGDIKANIDQFRLQRMRFGTHVASTALDGTTAPSPMLYYRPTERSFRYCKSLKNGGLTCNGGYITDANELITNYELTDPKSKNDIELLASSFSETGTENVYSCVLRSDFDPISHGTLRVEIYSKNNNTTPVESIDFFGNSNNLDPSLDFQFQSQYGDLQYLRKGTPFSKATKADGRTAITNIAYANNIYTNNGVMGGAVIYYEPPTTSFPKGQWKLKITLKDSASYALFQKVTLRYVTGRYNIANSIVPVIGSNVKYRNIPFGGELPSLSSRYSEGNTKDFYDIVKVEYKDAGSTSFIDDFACIFSCAMNGSDGNGEIETGLVTTNPSVFYKEAFLFNGRDDLFSAIYLQNPIEKNPDNAYYISWTILTPIN